MNCLELELKLSSRVEALRLVAWGAVFDVLPEPGGYLTHDALEAQYMYKKRWYQV